MTKETDLTNKQQETAVKQENRSFMTTIWSMEFIFIFDNHTVANIGHLHKFLTVELIIIWKRIRQGFSSSTGLLDVVAIWRLVGYIFFIFVQSIEHTVCLLFRPFHFLFAPIFLLSI